MYHFLTGSALALFSSVVFLFLIFRQHQPSTFLAMAIGYAECAHKDQRRKYTGELYTTHCLEVMEILQEYTTDEAVLAAAVLHDAIEDTTVTQADISRLFGPRVAALVLEVTDISKPQDGNRAVRKALDAEHLSRSSADGANIKLADLISNTASITTHDKDFAKIYLVEKLRLLPLLAHGDPLLHMRARECVLLAQEQVV